MVTQTEQGVLTEVSIPQESPEMTTNLDAMAYTQVSTTGEQTHLAANQDNSQVIATTDASTSQDSLHMSADLDATDHIIEDAMAGQDLNRGHEAAAPTQVSRSGTWPTPTALGATGPGSREACTWHAAATWRTA